MWQKIKSTIHIHEGLFFILIGSAILRIPNFFEPYWYGDEGIYLVVGQTMRAGSELYAQIIDHKTPIIYWLAAMTQTLVWFKLLLLLASLLSVVLFYLIAYRFFHKVWLRNLSTGLFALVITLPALEGNIANGELLLMPFVLGAIALFWWDYPRERKTKQLKQFYEQAGWAHPMAVGMLLAAALLTKVPAGFDFGVLVIFLLILLPLHINRKIWRELVKYGLLLGLGFIIPIFFSVWYFYGRGTVGSYIDFGLLYNFRYIAAWSTPFTHPVAIFLATLQGRILLLGVYLLGLFLWRKKFRLPLLYSLVWLGMTMFAVLLSLRPYPHYFMQLVPPATLSFGFLVQERAKIKLFITGLFLLAFLIFNSLGFSRYATLPYYSNFVSYAVGNRPLESYIAWFDAKTPQTYEMAQWLRTHTNTNERIFIWGDEPMVYASSRRSPVGRYTVAFHIHSFEAYDETMQALARYQPRYVIDYFGDRDGFGDFYAWLDKLYVPIEKIGVATIYRNVNTLQGF